MPEPIKTGKKLERRGDYGIHFVPVPDLGGSVNSDANRIIDTACEVLNGYYATGALTGESVSRLGAALTTAGCVREAEVDRFVVGCVPGADRWVVEDSAQVIGDSYYACSDDAGNAAHALNRLSQQTEGER